MKTSNLRLFFVLVGLASAGCVTHFREEQMAKERQACAELGIAPESDVFRTCVANLDYSIYEDQDTAGR